MKDEYLLITVVVKENRFCAYQLNNENEELMHHQCSFIS
jgi:hypothetical protein